MFGPMYMWWDPTYILIVIGVAISALASGYVNHTFNKYSDVSNRNGYTGADVAQLILEKSNIRNVSIRSIRGDLTDNYDSRNKTLNLSDSVKDSTSVAALGVAAHECGHAVQDEVEYFPLKLRAGLVPVANFGAQISMPLIFAGIFFGKTLINVGIFCFSLAFLFQLVTLPVEFNASRRAIRILDEQQILTPDELSMAKKVLFAAALTYVASAISVMLQLFRLILIFGNRNSRD